MSRSRETQWALAGVLALALVIAYWAALMPSADVARDEPVSLERDIGSDDKRDEAYETGFPPVLTWQPTGRDGHLRATYVTQQDLVSAATDLVRHYEQDEPCLLREATYLDLEGNTWACLVEGPGWVDLCLVRESEQELRTKVGIMRILLEEGERTWE